MVNDPADTANLALIRSHLAEEAALFRTGNYSDPAKIHGMDMPGLHELEAGAARVNVTYVDIPTGGQITYASNEAALVDALHACVRPAGRRPRHARHGGLAPHGAVQPARYGRGRK